MKAPTASITTASKHGLLRALSSWDIVVLVVPVLAISALLMTQAKFLWSKQHMQFFPLAYAAAVWFIYKEGKHDSFATGYRSVVSILASVSGIACAYAAILIQSSWLGNFAFDVLLFAWCLGRFANMSVLRVVGICSLLLVALPPPFDLDLSMIQWLQGVSTWVSTRLLDVLSINHVHNGNVIAIQAKSLFVEEACSGVDSQYALMAVAGVLLLVSNAGLFVSLATIITVPIWAILGNLLRINLIVLGIEFFEIDLSSGNPHTLLGMTTFALAAWAHWSSVQFLNWLQSYSVVPKKMPDSTFGKATADSPVVDSPRSSLTLVWWLAYFFTLLLIPIGLVFGLAIPRAKEPEITQKVRDMLPNQDDLPKQVLGFSFRDFQLTDREVNSIFGSHSRTWTYASNHGNHVFSLDLPFIGWHALWGCYERTGWQKMSRVLIQSDDLGAKLDSPYYEVRFQNDDGSYAILHFSLYDELGHPILEGDVNLKRSLYDRAERVLKEGLLRLGNESQSRFDKASFQIQLLSRSLSPPNDQMTKACREMFLRSRNLVVEESLPAFKEMLK